MATDISTFSISDSSRFGSLRCCRKCETLVGSRAESRRKLSRLLPQQIDQLADVVLAGVQIHHVESHPGAARVVYGREPRLAGRDHPAGEFFLKPIARWAIVVPRLPPSARD